MFITLKLKCKRLHKPKKSETKVARFKAVITDYIGTLVNANYYNMEASQRTLYKALTDMGFEIGLPEFLEAYAQSHGKYRAVRYEQFREVTNTVWICEALNSLGCTVNQEDSRIKTALNVFFEQYLESLELRPYAKKLLGRIKEQYKLGLVTNFTYAPVIYASLRNLGINQFFNAVVVSEENGWRKPHTRIFHDTIEKLQVNAEEAIFIGDSPLEDIKGAQAAGLRTVFVASQFYSLKNLNESGQKPDFVASGLEEIYRNFYEIINGLKPRKSFNG